MTKINNMKLRVFCGMCMNGLKTDVMKSGMQKYIRRGNLEKSLYCAVELDMFKELKGDKKVKGLRSNMRNRIIITLCEDIGISDWRIYEKIDSLLKLWEENRNSEDNCERKYLLEIINYMTNSEKLRMCSWIKGYFGYCFNDEEMKNKYYENINLEKTKYRCGLWYYKKNDSDEIKRLIDGVIYNLDNNSDNVFYWILKILKSKEISGRRGRKGKKGFIIFDILIKYIIKTKNKKLMKLFKIHENWYIKNNNSRGENLIYLLNLVLFYLRRDDIKWEDEIEEINLSNEDVNEIYNRNINDDYKFELDDFIIDMHCSDGKKEGKNAKNFVLEGSVVENESNFMVELYKNAYNEFKLNQIIKKGEEDKKIKNNQMKNKKKALEILNEKKIKKKKLNLKLEEELEFIDFKELMNIEKVEDLNEKLCRKQTCGGKVMTFINKEKGIIVKEMRKSFNYGRDCCIIDDLKKSFGIKKLGCKRVRSNMIVKKIDKKNKFWKENMEIKEEKCIYLIMDMFENLGTLVQNKKRRTEDKIKMDYFKIVLFRGIMKVTDTNYTNVLINKDDVLLSIDENNIGNRVKILCRRMSKCYNKEEVDSVIEDILKNKEEKLNEIKNKLNEYEMEYFYEMVEERMNNLKEIIYEEFKDMLKIEL